MQWEKTTAPMRATKMHAMRSTCVIGRMSPARRRPPPPGPRQRPRCADCPIHRAVRVTRMRPARAPWAGRRLAAQRQVCPSSRVSIRVGRLPPVRVRDCVSRRSRPLCSFRVPPTRIGLAAPSLLPIPAYASRAFPPDMTRTPNLNLKASHHSDTAAAPDPGPAKPALLVEADSEVGRTSPLPGPHLLARRALPIRGRAAAAGSYL